MQNFELLPRVRFLLLICESKSNIGIYLKILKSRNLTVVRAILILFLFVSKSKIYIYKNHLKDVYLLRETHKSGGKLTLRGSRDVFLASNFPSTAPFLSTRYLGFFIGKFSASFAPANAHARTSF